MLATGEVRGGPLTKWSQIKKSSETAMMAASFAENPPEYRKKLEATVPGGVLCQPEEIAETAVWLCSDHARRVNGQGIVVDGGGVLR